MNLKTVALPFSVMNQLKRSGGVTQGNKLYREFMISSADVLRSDHLRAANLCIALLSGFVVMKEEGDEDVIFEHSLTWHDVAFFLYPSAARHFDTCAVLADPCTAEFWDLIGQCDKHFDAIDLPDSIGKPE